ncbi:MAG: hypothetical protein RUMPE_01219 [Eubacteriales bacterium SKADARSKE-1]|nr:hypothetical protein [Eubacteriales bacterium SKADARSKE-1]
MPENKDVILEENEFKEMSTKKRVVWRIVSVVLFGFAIWAVVAITDFILDLIKNMFFPS